MNCCRILLFFGLVILYGCDKNETEFTDVNQFTGTGDYTFNSYEPFSAQPITCFYHIPETATGNSPIMIALHGSGREANNMRDYLIEKADEKNFIVLAPEFSEIYFPGSDSYNLGNIFDDGDNPEPESLNPTEEWTFSVIDPIYEDFKERVGNTTSTYDIFGHSAGSQILHRFLIFQPEASYNRVVCAAAGWYNMPDNSVSFPYGLEDSPAENANLGNIFAREVYVIVGENDVDPNSANLRHTPQADLQGNNRLERAQYFYNDSRSIADDLNLNFNWNYGLVPNAGHEGDANAVYAADLLYD